MASAVLLGEKLFLRVLSPMARGFPPLSTWMIAWVVPGLTAGPQSVSMVEVKSMNPMKNMTHFLSAKVNWFTPVSITVSITLCIAKDQVTQIQKPQQSRDVCVASNPHFMMSF